MIVLLPHLLTRDLHPKLRSASWKATMAEQRLLLLFADSPGLGRRAADDLQATYERVCASPSSRSQAPARHIAGTSRSPHEHRLAAA
jgi:hypothetical protein